METQRSRFSKTANLFKLGGLKPSKEGKNQLSSQRVQAQKPSRPNLISNLSKKQESLQKNFSLPGMASMEKNIRTPQQGINSTKASFPRSIASDFISKQLV